jgi:hypothetical protein
LQDFLDVPFDTANEEASTPLVLIPRGQYEAEIISAMAGPQKHTNNQVDSNHDERDARDAIERFRDRGPELIEQPYQRAAEESDQDDDLRGLSWRPRQLANCFSGQRRPGACRRVKRAVVLLPGDHPGSPGQPDSLCVDGRRSTLCVRM